MCCSIMQGLVPDDLYRFTWLSHVCFVPDSNLVAFNTKTVTEDHQDYRMQICVTDVLTGLTRSFTQGNHHDRILSAGRKGIYFLSDRVQETQVFHLPKDGGEARQLTHLDGGLVMAKLSFDENKLLLTRKIWPNDHAHEKKTETTIATSYKVSRINYKADGDGLWDGSFLQMFVMDLPTGAMEPITEVGYDVESFAWSPKGDFIAYVAKKDADSFRFTNDLYVVDLTTKETRCLTKGDLQLETHSFSPDGTRIVCYGNDFSRTGATQTTLYTCLVDGSEEMHRFVSDDFLYDIAAQGMSDMRGHEALPSPLFMDNGLAVLAPCSIEGAVSLARFSLAGDVQVVVGGKREIYTYDYDAKGNNVAFLATDPCIANELFVVDVTNKHERQLTDVNAWMQDRQVAVVEEFTSHSSFGRDLQAWIMMPTIPQTNEKTPVILEVHGGPHAMYSYSFFFEFQLLATQGYAVVFGNPRGSSGYGQEFVDACRGDYGGGDYEDVLTILDSALVRYTNLDNVRVGLTGGSYGGFMTNWIVSHTDRFKAAVTQRSISNWISFYGVSDIGYFFTQWEMKYNTKETQWGDIDRLWKHSPLRYAANVTTPLLILHGEDDLRCPIEQAEQWYTVLTSLGKEVSFIRFPKSSHDLSRTGKPGLRVQRYESIMNWFVRYV